MAAPSETDALRELIAGWGHADGPTIDDLVAQSAGTIHLVSRMSPANTHPTFDALVVAHQQPLLSNVVLQGFTRGCDPHIEHAKKADTPLNVRAIWRTYLLDTSIRIVFCARLTRATRWIGPDEWALEYAVLAFHPADSPEADAIAKHVALVTSGKYEPVPESLI